MSVLAEVEKYIDENEYLINKLQPIICYNAEYKYKLSYSCPEENLMGDLDERINNGCIYYNYDEYAYTMTFYVKHDYDDDADTYVMTGTKSVYVGMCDVGPRSGYIAGNHKFEDAGTHTIDKKHLFIAMENEEFFARVCNILNIYTPMSLDEINAKLAQKQAELNEITERGKELTSKIEKLQEALEELQGPSYIKKK